MANFLSKVLSFGADKDIKAFEKIATQITNLEPQMQAMSDEELRGQTKKFKERYAKGESLDDLLPEAFATVREASVRTTGLRHFDVQLVGGIALHKGTIAEMKTGEGKTLVSTLAGYLNALSGDGVHIVTVNDYLAKRDTEWMGKIYKFLGMTVGLLQNGMRLSLKKPAYEADVTYGTNSEFGFDYLRDNMVTRPDMRVQRGHNFAIVDEVDSILIDEARTPLIISGAGTKSAGTYRDFARAVRGLIPEVDFEMDEAKHTIATTDTGLAKVERALGMEIYGDDAGKLVNHLQQALKAEFMFHRDQQYVVMDGEVKIVDEFTGRIMEGRRYSEGLHQAIEAKEGVPVLEESMTLATISFQNYFRLYNKLSGMTGTAFTEAEEFQQIYSLDVIQIPPNKPVIREDKEDLIFKTEKAKLKAVAEAIKDYHKQGRPVLVGSGSIEKNEQIAKYLEKEGIKFEILNAKNNEREAAIVAKAGEKGAITLATNIAGRGTDIKLGEGVKELGGLVVIGSERHESRRIDNQLRGRGGRQGDPGETQFYVSTEDDLMRIFQGERIASLMDRLGVDDDTPIRTRAVSKTLEAAQKRVEGYNFDTRKNVVQYDNVINRHRRVVYVMRRRILEGDNIKPEIERLLRAKVHELTTLPLKNNPKFVEDFSVIFPVDKEKIEKVGKEKKDRLRYEKALELAEEAYAEKEREIGADDLRGVEREVYMAVLDTLWMQHLENMQHLREGIHWRSVGQRDPLVEYRSESQKLFESLQANLRDEVLVTIFNIHKADATVRQSQDDEYDTELTRLAENAVERGVNEIGSGEENRDGDFSVKKGKTSAESNRVKNQARKKKKAQRQNRKKNRK